MTCVLSGGILASTSACDAFFGATGEMEMSYIMKTDILIVGSGCSGLYCALQLPRDRKITLITRSDLETNDSFLAQGGMCMLKEESDFQSYFEDTLRAGHQENDRESVEIMIRSSQALVKDLLSYGVRFARDEQGALAFTREGAHRQNRIVYYKDVTGKEITSHLLEQVKKLSNVTLYENTTMVDIIERENTCYGAVLRMEDGSLERVEADYTVLATGGVGGLYKHSTNYRHLKGDGLAVALRHDIRLKDIHYVQIHPTTFYSEHPEKRSFLISESVRGEGALLYDKHMNRFVDELLPRDLLTIEIRKQMEKDGTEFVWEDLRTIPEDELRSHFPNIIQHCLDMGYDVFKEPIPVVPAQHYFMGGIWVDHQSRTSMNRLYAVGETACNGVHGKNRLASNSLLESMVFAKRAADEMAIHPVVEHDSEFVGSVSLAPYEDQKALEEQYRDLVRDAIKKSRQEAEQKQADRQ